MAGGRMRSHFPSPFAPNRVVEADTEQAGAVGLRFYRDDPATDVAQRAGPVADMRADIEHELTRTDELPVELAQPPLAARNTVIDRERPPETPETVEATCMRCHSLILGERPDGYNAVRMSWETGRLGRIGSDSRAGVTGLRVLSLVMGLFLVLMGNGKTAWLSDTGLLLDELFRWRDLTSGISLWYLETVAIPGAPLFARFVPIAEMLAGAALIAGFRIHLTAALALGMILNFHFASGLIFTAGYLTNGYGPPVIGSLLALAIGGRRLPFCLTR